MNNIAKSVEPRSTEFVVQMSLFENNCTTPFFLPVEAPKTKPFDKAQGLPFELREYQKHVIQELTELYKKGKRRPFVYAPTGSGKTAIAAKILANSTSKGRRCLFLVHRDPLVEQTQEALAVYGIQAGIIKAGYKENRSLGVQIASIQSLAQRQFPDGIDVIVIDEAHTTCWYKIFERIKEHYSQAFYIGLTATPWRSKQNEYMGQHFDSIVKAPSVAELIRLGCLAPPRYFGFGGLLDLADIDNGEDGDFDKHQMQRACMKSGFNERIVKEYLCLTPERSAIIFCAGVQQSRLVTELFNTAGVTCEHLEADTDIDLRKQMYARLKTGKTRILSSVGTLTEGFNIELISCVILARPTRSRALLFQMAGRGLRTFSGKKDCYMLDFGENFSRLGYLTDPQPIQLEPLKRKSEPQRLIKECSGCHEMISVFALICPFCGFEFSADEALEDDSEAEAEELDSKMGELFAEDQKQKLKYLRTQIRNLYKHKLQINNIWEIFEDKWGHPAPNEWHKGAVFGKRNTEANRQKYLDYLHNINPKQKNQFWINFHMELEFGKRTHQQQEQHETPRGSDFQRLTWWTILGVLPGASLGDIKSAYKQLAKKYHPDWKNFSPDESDEKMKLINLAYEQAKRYFNERLN